MNYDVLVCSSPGPFCQFDLCFEGSEWARNSAGWMKGGREKRKTTCTIKSGSGLQVETKPG